VLEVQMAIVDTTMVQLSRLIHQAQLITVPGHLAAPDADEAARSLIFAAHQRRRRLIHSSAAETHGEHTEMIAIGALFITVAAWTVEHDRITKYVFNHHRPRTAAIEVEALMGAEALEPLCGLARRGAVAEAGLAPVDGHQIQLTPTLG